MSASTQTRTPATGPGKVIALPVAANIEIFGGSLVARNAAGNSIPAADTAGLKVGGVAQGDVDNLLGDAGDLSAPCDRGAVELNNSALDPVTKADVLNPVFVEDDNTVSKTGGVNQIVAGILLGVSDDGATVIVDTALAPVVVIPAVVESSEPASSEPASSSAPASSEPASSAPASSEPASSSAPASSSEPASSSAPASSASESV